MQHSLVHRDMLEQPRVADFIETGPDASLQHRQYMDSRREKDKLPNPTACLLAQASQSLWLILIYDACER